MGRELRRVPLDFDWPMHQVWRGYINPYSGGKCKSCDCSGYNPETKKIADDYYDLGRTGARWCSKITQDEVDALIAAGRLMDFTHTYNPGEGWERIEPPPVVTAEQVNEWNEEAFGHDGINRGILIETRAKRLGVYGFCKYCEGTGTLWPSPEYEKLYNEFEWTEPPAGPGYQLWETTSEGSPVSPVFETLEGLCAWCEKGATTFGSYRASKEEWMNMLSDGLVSHKEGNAIFL